MKRGQLIDKEKQQSGKCRLITKQVLSSVYYVNLLEYLNAGCHSRQNLPEQAK